MNGFEIFVGLKKVAYLNPLVVQITEQSCYVTTTKIIYKVNHRGNFNNDFVFSCALKDAKFTLLSHIVCVFL